MFGSFIMQIEKYYVNCSAARPRSWGAAMELCKLAEQIFVWANGHSVYIITFPKPNASREADRTFVRTPNPLMALGDPPKPLPQ